jgi:hypothetical protein
MMKRIEIKRLRATIKRVTRDIQFATSEPKMAALKARLEELETYIKIN